MNQEQHVSLLVVGGGIGGLPPPWPWPARPTVHLIEQAAEFAEIGAGLQIGANATRVMDRLGVLEAVARAAVHPERATMRDARTGEKLTGLTLGNTYRNRYGFPYLVMHRSDLLQILLDACTAEPSITLENNRTVNDVNLDAESVRVDCADGSRYRADVVIGADRLRSRLRRLFVEDEPVCSGYVAYRGTMPIQEVSTDVEANDVVLWVGPRMHLMQYPVRAGALYNQVAVFHSESFASGRDEWGTPEELDAVYADTVEPVRRSAASVPGLGTGPSTTASRWTPTSGAGSRSSATPPTRCCRSSARAPARPSRTPSGSPTSSSRTPGRREGAGLLRGGPTPPHHPVPAHGAPVGRDLAPHRPRRHRTAQPDLPAPGRRRLRRRRLALRRAPGVTRTL